MSFPDRMNVPHSVQLPTKFHLNEEYLFGIRENDSSIDYFGSCFAGNHLALGSFVRSTCRIIIPPGGAALLWGGNVGFTNFVTRLEL